MSSLPAKPPVLHVEERSDSYSTVQPSLAEATRNVPLDVEGNADEHDYERSIPSASALEQPPLPDEEPPPLPNEPVPHSAEDDGWEPVWDENAQAFYFYNRLTKATQWENPRIPQATVTSSSTGVADNGPPGATTLRPVKKAVAGGYDPAIHGDYDPNADYAKAHESENGAQQLSTALTDPTSAYAATGAFNRFTGKWQSTDINPEKFSDENKSNRQMNAFFDVDAAANAHDGRSLKAERSSKKITKQELKAYREKRKEKKEEKRRAWLRD